MRNEGREGDILNRTTVLSCNKLCVFFSYCKVAYCMGAGFRVLFRTIAKYTPVPSQCAASSRQRDYQRRKMADALKSTGAFKPEISQHGPQL